MLKKKFAIKRIGILNFVQIILIVSLAISVIYFILKQMNMDILAIVVSVISLALSILNTISSSIESRREIFIKQIQSRSYNKNLFEDIEKAINELREDKKNIDTIDLIDDCGYNNHQQTAIIVYH